jgi:hypothetical protein
MRRFLAVAIFAVLAVPLFPSLALAQCQQSCDGLITDDPHYPASRGYLEFIDLAYYGAYGHGPTCVQRVSEYNALVSAAGNSALQAEASRFVATLFMTQASYDAQDLTTYTQTTAYEARNSNNNIDRTSLQSFVTDLYHAFLQRDPDDGGLCFWTNDACGGRKHVILAFIASIEFGRLVGGLYDDGPPDSCGPGGGGDCPGSNGGYGQLCS